MVLASFTRGELFVVILRVLSTLGTRLVGKERSAVQLDQLP